METESYKKIGRGGAGNFYSKQDIEEATKDTAEVSKETQNFLEHYYSLSSSKLVPNSRRIWKHKAQPSARQLRLRKPHAQITPSRAVVGLETFGGGRIMWGVSRRLRVRRYR